MKKKHTINPKHAGVRTFLRVVGPIIALTGLALLISGICRLFSGNAFSVHPLQMFGGMGFLFIGVVMTMFGFMGAVARYQAHEIAPVGKDAFNYLADGTKGGVKTVASAIGEGLATGLNAQETDGIVCGSCGHANEPDSKFCDQCGTPIARKTCPSCDQTNDPDAKFCDNCGQSLV